MRIYQFTIKPWDQKEWPKKVNVEVNCKNALEAGDQARNLAIKNKADIRFNVKGHSRKHYLRLSEAVKNKLLKI